MELVIIYVAVAIFMIFLSLGLVYYGYKRYQKGQRRCEMLYPGTSLKALRAQEECKMRKQQIWSLPAAATMI